jgi:hypothetical protein
MPDPPVVPAKALGVVLTVAKALIAAELAVSFCGRRLQGRGFSCGRASLLADPSGVVARNSSEGPFARLASGGALHLELF